MKKKPRTPILVRVGVWVTMICLGIALILIILSIISTIGGV